MIRPRSTISEVRSNTQQQETTTKDVCFLACRVPARLRLFKIVESLGSVESLVVVQNRPASGGNEFPGCEDFGRPGQFRIVSSTSRVDDDNIGCGRGREGRSSSIPIPLTNL
jgi:hypothetical protein